MVQLSDEFEGKGLDFSRWQTEPMTNGWGWLGRPPGLFMTDNVSVDSGTLKVVVSKLKEPVEIQGDRFVYKGAIVRSLEAVEPGMFIECRMKANAKEMSSTFWLMTKGGVPQSYEMDIQECIGVPSTEVEKWGQNWDRIFHSNLIHVDYSNDGARTQLQNQVSMEEPNYTEYHVYGAWWKSEREIQFFLNGEYAYSLYPEIDWNVPSYIHMAIETYSWNPVPDVGTKIEKGTLEERTTFYDWVRTWRIVE
ncbi:MAG: family 16 glycosylhydrolase [Coraliomargaritaceae bacterium]